MTSAAKKTTPMTIAAILLKYFINLNGYSYYIGAELSQLIFKRAVPPVNMININHTASAFRRKRGKNECRTAAQIMRNKVRLSAYQPRARKRFCLLRLYPPPFFSAREHI